MRKSRFNIIPVYNAGSGKYGYEIHRKAHETFVSPCDYISEEAALADAELKKVELQEAMMKAEPKPPKEKKPRKVKSAKAKREPCKYISVTQYLFDAIEALQAITIGDAGDNIDRLRKAAETIENVRKDLSEIE